MQLRIQPRGDTIGKNSDSTKDIQSTSSITSANATVEQSVQRDGLKKKLEVYRDRLLQIERRNRSILLRRVYDKWSFDLAKLVIRGNSVADRAAERAILKKNAICIIPDSDDTELAEKDRGRLRTLNRNITQLELETGLQETYLGFPFIVGHIGQDTYIRGPFALFPVSVEYKKDGRPPGWYLNFPKEKPPIANRAMIAAIRKKGGITLPDSFYDEFEDLVERAVTKTSVSINTSTEGQESTGDRADVRFVHDLIELLLKCNFPLKPEQNKMDKIEILEPLTAEQEVVLPKESLHFVNHKLFGNFPQGDTAIYADYEELMKRAEAGETNQGIIDNLLEVPSPEDHWTGGNEDKELTGDIDLDNIPAKELNLALESDSSQDAVIVTAQKQECTVVRGPPGTGKSQVIVNLISNALADGKKVLLVCQKRAALDVVYQRLDKVGLSDYISLLQDPVNDRHDLYHHLSKILNFGSESNGSNSQSTIETKLTNLSELIDNIIKNQCAIVTSLHKQFFGGVTAHQLYALAQPGYTPILDISSIASHIQYDELDQLIGVVGSLEAPSKIFDKQDYILVHRRSFANFGIRDKKRMFDCIEELLQEVSKTQDFIVVSDLTQQQALIESLRTLIAENGMFRRLKPKWKEASHFVKNLLNDQDFPTIDSARIESAITRSENGLRLLTTFQRLAEYISDVGLDQLKADIIPVLNKDALQLKLSSMKDSLVNFDLIQEYDSRLASLNTQQMEMFQVCRSKLMDKSGWGEILRQEIYADWIEQIERENPALRSQPFETYIENRRQLSRSINEHRNLVIRKISQKIKSNITKPGITAHGHRSHRSDALIWSKLADDLDKKRRVLSVRKLIEKYESIIFNVSPCWLASPEAVASIFPLKRKLFDFIIFDEASQSAVERSLTSLYRGDHIVIMGDEKQLRPFDLFRTKDDEDEEDEIVDDSMLSESLLVLAKRIYGYRYLAWHYRSKYQELIDFSNHAFYDGHLQVAPNILRSPDIPPIRWVNCGNGLWENRQNLPEATLVVDEIKKMLAKNESNHTSKSIGIITFNESQQAAILDEIDRRKKQDPKFDRLYTTAENPISKNLDDKPFVKNIENVQGDERDIIIFSVGYARDSEGHLRIRFGTLNQDGGENRLNVAITRARQEIVVVCSIDPNELKTDSAKNNGPKRLKDYLQYAKFISECRSEGAEKILLTLDDGFARVGNPATNKMLLFDSPFEEIVYDRLKYAGYTVDTQVGYSGYRIDLAIVHPDDPSRYILAIECDGAAFHAAKSTRERDVMRQEFLESRGWTVERIWSKNWWRNPDREIERIKGKIEELRSASKQITKE